MYFMLMLCYKCGRSWNYKGKNTEGEGYITCPGCLYKIRVDKALVGSPFSQKLLTNNKPLPIKLPKKLLTTKKIKPLQIKEPVLDLQKKEKTPVPGIAPGCFDQFGESVQIKEIPYIKIIRTIPRDPIKLLEHQRSFM